MEGEGDEALSSGGGGDVGDLGLGGELEWGDGDGSVEG